VIRERLPWLPASVFFKNFLELFDNVLGVRPFEGMNSLITSAETSIS